MAVSNSQRLHKCLEELRDGIKPYCGKAWSGFYGDDWLAHVNNKLHTPDRDPSVEDLSFLLKGIKATWSEIWKLQFGTMERNLVFELADIRNRWAHNKPFSTDDTYRALDSIERLLGAFGAQNHQERVKKQRLALTRQRLASETQADKSMVATLLTKGDPMEGLTPWREIIDPHKDVASGQFEQSEFAADLRKVWQGQADDEYQDPQEFFSRTYLTEGLRQLLSTAARRLAGQGGNPVVELQTNFGGGKTHSLIALYHLASGTDPADLPGVGEMLAEAEIALPQEIKRAVFVGQWESPATPDVKPDGTEVNTMWGEIAYQLGGPQGYALIAEDDAAATNPGKKLITLFENYGPAIILIDEWVAYARQLKQEPSNRLPGGDFDTQFTFAQTLTEAAAAVENVVVLVAIPSSDIEIGGELGREARSRLTHVVSRVDSKWQPASPDESFEIVRRRLFEEIPADKLRARDQVVEAFGAAYRKSEDFPSEAQEKAYQERIKKYYPIHPELFDRLFEDWSSLEKFQRTRGVLRLMALVISYLWSNDDRNLLIMPGTLPLNHPELVAELKNYLEDGWDPIIKKDVDGAGALPTLLDKDNRLGKYSATRRVARSIFMASAPRPPENLGVDIKRVVLGCAQPGEKPGQFVDALKRLSNQATYLYVDASSYWYQLSPNVNRTAQDRAESNFDDVHADDEIRRRLQAIRRAEPFIGVHIFPDGPGDVPDEEDGVRLVILPLSQEHVRKSEDSKAIKAADDILSQRSAGPRQYRNTLVFLAVTENEVDSLRRDARLFKAWQSIEDDFEALNLTPHQQKQAKSRLEEADKALDARIDQGFTVILTPLQKAGHDQIDWVDTKPSGAGTLPERVANKLKSEEKIIDHFSGVRVRMDLNHVAGLWSERGDIEVQKLWSAYATYPYMPRLTGFGVLAAAINDGVASISWESETFAYADAHDGDTWVGIKRATNVNPARSGFLIRPDVVPPPPAAPEPFDTDSETVIPVTETDKPESPVRETVAKTRFYAQFNLDQVRGIKELEQILSDVVNHLGDNVTISLEIEADLDSGFDDRTQRVVKENARHLGSTSFEFE